MDQPRFQLTQGDAVAWLRTLPDAAVDLVITDPPYESLEKHRAIGTTTRLKHSKASSNDWFSIFPNARFPELFAEIWRVLKKDTHFYLFCDPETMFVAKPIAEQVGFKFWKPLIWDKCLGPDTLVWTTRGVIRIEDITVGDRVAIPEGGTTNVRAVRRTRAPALALRLSDGTELIASHEHRFMLANVVLVEADQLRVGDTLCTRPMLVREDRSGPHQLPLLADDRRAPTGAASVAHHPVAHHPVAHHPVAHHPVAHHPVAHHPVAHHPVAHHPVAHHPVAHHPITRPATITVAAIADLGERDLIDISVEDRAELFLLANGVVTHNCKIGMGYHYRARYECVLFFEKGKRKLLDLGIADIIEAPRIVNGYPAEKPPEVSEVLVKQSTEPGELVIDPFMGSGSIGVAAIRSQRDFRGNDLCAEALDITRSRLREGGGLEGERTLRGAPAPQLGLTL